MAVTAALVKELRERTGAGMMECKKALVATEGDIDAAIEAMRKSGAAKADKKADRVAADGVVYVETVGDKTVMLEVNSETDFVAKGDDFNGFVAQVAKAVLEQKPADVAALNACDLGGKSVDETRKELIVKIGENLAVRRFEVIDGSQGPVGVYSHGSRIAAVVALKGGDAELAKDIAMHVTASVPQYVKVDDVDPDFIAKEKAILVEQALASGKPADIVEKMVEGRLRKQLGEITLYGQPFVKDPDQTVEKLVKAAGAEVLSFDRYAVGEGIEKEETDFAAEVAAQARV